ncbi:hypothetical protein ACFVZH_01465 [Streptomyces sp. NPDC059534]|uniref:hypothetical protein n=1 Tax=Streptomyces sp. NPDC059534 TaxID=3346859 RepID=UPI0036CFA6F4
MALREGRRVSLAADLRLTGSLVPAGPPAPNGDFPPTADAVAGFLSLASGTEGTVERVDEHVKEQSHEVREYLRLSSLLADFGPQMPPASRKQLEEQVGSLEADWTAYQEQAVRVTVRVRLDNGFVLDEARVDLFAETVA